MTQQKEVMARLRSLKRELATRYDVLEIGIFGSVARGENDKDSDLDLYVEFGPNADLITYIGLWQFLEDTFGTKLDLISKGGLRSDMRDAVFQDLVYV
jgi:predicted nucleotidyltransferase